jgi:hypothetical protein
LKFASMVIAAGVILLLALPLRAEDSCPADLQKLKSAVKEISPGVNRLPAMTSQQLEKQTKVMEDCRWNHSGGTDNPEPYAEMRDQLTDELIRRYRTFIVKHNLMNQLEREEAAASSR